MLLSEKTDFLFLFIFLFYLINWLLVGQARPDKTILAE